MGKQKEAKGQITLVGLSGVTQYFLKPSVTQVVIKNDGSLNTDVVTCTAYKAEDAEMTELSSSEGVIKYTIDNGSEYIDYTDDGVPVDTNWSMVSFFLFLTGMSNYQVRADVSIIRNGQVDTNFRVWVGTQANPNSPFQRPWLGEEGEPQTDDMHIGDYYVSPNMQYYCFGYNDITSSYEWDEVTDVNLKKWLARADNSTTGFIVPEGTSVTDYFKNRDYVIGDLWANATYGAYNNEPLICRQSKNSTFGFRISDWQPISDIKEKLRNTGINIDEYKVIVSGDETWFVNNNGERQAIFNFQGDHPVISTDLLQIDGGLIVGALSSEPQVFQDFMKEGGYNSVSITTNEESGDIQATIGDNTYTWTSKPTDQLVQYSTTTADGVTNNFSLSKQGLLTAHNAVIYGKVYASEGAFTGQLSSSGGAFNVDVFGNVTATSFNGEGVFNSKTTVITKYNFYDYFMKSALQSEDTAGTEWIPNLKKIGHKIRIESLPETDEFPYDSQENVRAVEITFPRYIKYANGSVSCRRGGLTVGEMFALHNQVYSIETSDDVACSISGHSIIRHGVQVLQYNVHGDDGSAVDNEIYVTIEQVATIDLRDKKWQDCETDGSVSSAPETVGPSSENEHKECTIYIHHINSDKDYHYFSWYCASEIDTQQLGDNIAIPGFRNTSETTIITVNLKGSSSNSILQSGNFSALNNTEYTDWNFNASFSLTLEAINTTYHIIVN